MTTRIRNLHGYELIVCGNNETMGRLYLGAQLSVMPYVAYVYYAPETRSTWIVSTDQVRVLGRIVYAIAMHTAKYLRYGEAKQYTDPEDDTRLCDLERAYSIWRASSHALEGFRCDVDL